MNPPCEFCHGTCCKSHRECSVELNDNEVPLFPEAILVDDGLGSKVWGIPNVDGHCIHLKNERCSIYENRPHLCKQYNCLNGYDPTKKRHSFFLGDHPEVVELLELHLHRRNL